MSFPFYFFFFPSDNILWIDPCRTTGFHSSQVYGQDVLGQGTSITEL